MYSNNPSTSGVSLMDLSIHQLGQLKYQIEQDLELFEHSLDTLKSAQDKFMLSGACLDSIPTGANTILVPLTSSLYVSGEISDTENVIIDIGTGYFANKTVDSAREYFKRKVEFLNDQMDTIQTIGAEKNSVRKSIHDVMKTKLKAETKKEPKKSTKKQP